MESIFIDTDIALDLLSQRQQHYAPAAKLFSLADKKQVEISISSLSFATLNYLLTRQYDAAESKRLLVAFKILMNVLPVDDKIVTLALASKFTDFEDAIQYFTAMENNIPILISRNIKDYRLAQIPVMNAESYMATRSGGL